MTAGLIFWSVLALAAPGADAKEFQTSSGPFRVDLLSVRREGEPADGRDPASRTRLAARLSDLVRQQLEIVDDQTRRVEVHPTTGLKQGQARATPRTVPGADAGAPDRLRIFALPRTKVAVP